MRVIRRVTIVLPISREEYLDSVLGCLERLEKPHHTSLLIILDGNAELERKVKKAIGKLRYKDKQVHRVFESPANTIDERRWRISHIHNTARRLIPRDAEYVFLIEDDTTFPTYALTRMLDALRGTLGGEFDMDINGYIEGVQLGRHGTPYVGAWAADDIDDPEVFSSLRKGMGQEYIDAGGFYCCLTRADLYRDHFFQPYDQKGRNGLSCDVNYGISLRRKGYRCLIDWSIVCGHLGPDGELSIRNTRPARVVFEKENGKWLARTEADYVKVIK